MIETKIGQMKAKYITYICIYILRKKHMTSCK